MEPSSGLYGNCRSEVPYHCRLNDPQDPGACKRREDALEPVVGVHRPAVEL